MKNTSFNYEADFEKFRIHTEIYYKRKLELIRKNDYRHQITNRADIISYLNELLDTISEKPFCFFFALQKALEFDMKYNLNTQADSLFYTRITTLIFELMINKEEIQKWSEQINNEKANFPQ